MRLIKPAVGATPAVTLNLPNDLMWSDEHDWVPVVTTTNYSLTGALLVETAARQAGRLITLVPSDKDMAWITRSDLATLRAWASIPGLILTLALEYPADTRQFQVMFRHADKAVEGKPIKGFPGHDAGDWFNVSLRLIEV